MSNNISQHILWNGFQYKWNRFPHRLSILGSRFNNAIYRPNNISVYHEQALKIGNLWQEMANYTTTYTALQIANVYMGNGRTPTIEINTPIEQLFDQTFTFKVRLAELYSSSNHLFFSDNQALTASVLLNGFFLRPLNNISGWHLGGWGLKIVSATMLNHEEVQFEVRVYCRPAASPEPAPHGNKDENNVKWTAAIPCCYELEIDYSIIVAAAANIDIADMNLNSEAERVYHFDKKITIDAPFNPDKYQNAFVGLRGFYFQLSSHKAKAKKTGRYIRHLSAYLNDLKVDAKTGKVSCQGNFGFSNTILNKKVITALPWNLKTDLYVSRIAINEAMQFRHGNLNSYTLAAPNKNLDSHAYLFARKLDINFGKQDIQKNERLLV